MVKSHDTTPFFGFDELTHSIRFQGISKKKAFAAKIDITYEEHM